MREETATCGNTEPQPVGRSGLEQRDVTDFNSSRLRNQPSSSGAESGAESADSAPKALESDTDRLAVIADLLADLPQAGRREVIAQLPRADRAAIARLLIGRNPGGPDRQGNRA